MRGPAIARGSWCALRMSQGISKAVTPAFAAEEACGGAQSFCVSEEFRCRDVHPVVPVPTWAWLAC